MVCALLLSYPKRPTVSRFLSEFQLTMRFCTAFDVIAFRCTHWNSGNLWIWEVVSAVSLFTKSGSPKAAEQLIGFVFHLPLWSFGELIMTESAELCALMGQEGAFQVQLHYIWHEVATCLVFGALPDEPPGKRLALSFWYNLPYLIVLRFGSGPEVTLSCISLDVREGRKQSCWSAQGFIIVFWRVPE